MIETRSLHAFSAALVLLAGAATGAMEEGPPEGEADAVVYSEAERVLWMTDQLHMIEHPLRLVYRFEKSGTLEDGFTDVVEMEIFAVNADGTKNVRVHFFTGERNHFVPEREGLTVNPVLGIYLQGDVYEMDRLTEGHWRYFHRRLKYAFAESAHVEPVSVEFDGRTVEAQRVRVTPYVEDEHRDEMRGLHAKEYYITVSDSIPAYLYEIYTVVPGEEGGPPLLEERLRLVEVAPLSG